MNRKASKSGCMRRRPWLGVLLLLASCIAPSLTGAAESTDPTGGLSLELLQEQLAQIEGSAELDDATRTQIREQLERASANLRAAATYGKNEARFRESLTAAPEETARLAGEKDLPPRPPDPATLAQLSSSELEQQLQQAKASLATATKLSTELEEQSLQLGGRPGIIRQRLSEIATQKSRTEAELAATSPTAEHPQIAQARQLALQAQLRALAAENAMLDQERFSQQVRSELLNARREAARRQVQQRQADVTQLEQVLNQRHQQEAGKAKAEAEAVQLEAIGKHPVLERLARRNAELGAEIEQLASDLDDLANKQRRDTELAKQVEERFTLARQKIDVAGLSQVLGQVLLEERRSLPDLRRYRRVAAAREEQMAITSLSQLQLTEEQRRLQDTGEYVANLFGDLPPADADPIRPELLQLADKRRELVDKALTVQSAYLVAQGEIDFAQRHLIEITESYDDFLGRHLLWIRSAPPVNLETMGAIPGQIIRLFSPAGWSEVVASFARNLISAPYLALGLLAFLLLQLRRAALRQGMLDTARYIGSLRHDRLAHTFKALGFMVLLALPVPMLLLVTGWEIRNDYDAGSFAKVFGSSLLKIAPITLYLSALQILIKRGGIAAAHFRWSDLALHRLRLDLRWFTPSFILGAWLTIMAFQSDTEHLGSGLGRLGFVVVMGILAIFFYRLSHPQNGTLQLFAANNPGGLLARFRYLWSTILVGAPITFALVALLGYLYTAGTLIEHILQSVWMILLLIVTHQLTFRWLLLTRRRIAFAAARAKRQTEREAQEISREDSEGLSLDVEEPEIDLVALSSDSQKLLNNTLGLATVLGLWSIWGDLLPAFSVFTQVELWHYSAEVDGSLQQIPVTLGGVAFALLVVFATVIVARQLPALLEISLLQRLALTPASRYTVTTLTQYAVVGIGTALTFSILGGSWAQLQWIVAALGVGIGFGLQEIVANFISGLIILFERPIRVGDVVTVGDTDGVVTKIRIRATTIRNWDRKELLVPNKEFITQKLLNWSLSDQVIRILIRVGVAYGSDVRKALLILEEVAQQHPRLLKDPPPFVVFENFGDSALVLSLRCYIDSVDYRMATVNDLNLAINDRFAEAGIEIAFPQQDVHLTTSRPLEFTLKRDSRKG